MTDTTPPISYLPLEGVRVLDLTHVIAGPLATHQLCMMGAVVIKVERPEEGDGVRATRTQPDQNGVPPASQSALACLLKISGGYALTLSIAPSRAGGKLAIYLLFRPMIMSSKPQPD